MLGVERFLEPLRGLDGVGGDPLVPLDEALQVRHLHRLQRVAAPHARAAHLELVIAPLRHRRPPRAYLARHLAPFLAHGREPAILYDRFGFDRHVSLLLELGKVPSRPHLAQAHLG